MEKEIRMFSAKYFFFTRRSLLLLEEKSALNVSKPARKMAKSKKILPMVPPYDILLQ